MAPNYYEPCTQNCGQKTSHASGKCQKCRGGKCTRCKAPFVPEKGRTSKHCGRCEAKLKEIAKHQGE